VHLCSSQTGVWQCWTRSFPDDHLAIASKLQVRLLDKLLQAPAGVDGGLLTKAQCPRALTEEERRQEACAQALSLSLLALFCRCGYILPEPSDSKPVQQHSISRAGKYRYYRKDATAMLGE
jgi:hypothetical protein